MKPMSFCLALILTAGICHADDGWIGNSGSPHLMSGHRSVRMKSEKVVMTVGRQETWVTATFQFVNSGPATSVRMGFPDEDDSGDDSGSIQHFRSWIQGTEVKTRHVQGSDRMWFVKRVRFPAHSKLEIRDRYRVATGVARWSPHGMYHAAFYRVDTGRSWLGKIDKAEVIVKFAKDVPPPTYASEDKAWMTAEFSDKQQAAFVARAGRHVWTSGLADPELRGHTLYFVEEDFKPTEDDDLSITFMPIQMTPHQDEAYSYGRFR